MRDTRGGSDDLTLRTGSRALVQYLTSSLACWPPQSAHLGSKAPDLRYRYTLLNSTAHSFVFPFPTSSTRFNVHEVCRERLLTLNIEKVRTILPWS
jgi:hypothetical protein